MVTNIGARKCSGVGDLSTHRERSCRVIHRHLTNLIHPGIRSVEVADVPGKGVATLGDATGTGYQGCASRQNISYNGTIEIDLAIVVALVRAGFVYNQIVSDIATEGHDVLAAIVLWVPGQTSHSLTHGKGIICSSGRRDKFGANFGLIFGFQAYLVACSCAGASGARREVNVDLESAATTGAYRGEAVGDQVATYTHYWGATTRARDHAINHQTTWNLIGDGDAGGTSRNGVKNGVGKNNARRYGRVADLFFHHKTIGGSGIGYRGLVLGKNLA